MDLLLDTHTFLWFVTKDSRLSPRALQLISDPSNVRVLSLVSIWEIAIKSSKGRLSFEQPLPDLIDEQIEVNNLALLKITREHVLGVAALPFYHTARHTDPFDRLLIVQALMEPLPIVSVDTKFDAYGVTRLW